MERALSTETETGTEIETKIEKDVEIPQAPALRVFPGLSSLASSWLGRPQDDTPPPASPSPLDSRDLRRLEAATRDLRETIKTAQRRNRS